MHKPRPGWLGSARGSAALGPSPLTTRRKVTEVPLPGRTVPRVPPNPGPPAGAGSALARRAVSDVITRRQRRAASVSARAAARALGWTDMAREVRTLLLWGRRLRAAALAATPGGEGNRTGRRDGMHGGSEAVSPSVGGARTAALARHGGPIYSPRARCWVPSGSAAPRAARCPQAVTPLSAACVATAGTSPCAA